jgi:two-component system sensor histidine kinase KdpD
MQIKQEAEALDEMVRNLLAITRIDAGALELRKDWIDLAEIVNRVVRATRRQRPVPLQLEVKLPEDLPLIRADPTLAEQALTNVVANAITHTPAGTRIVISALAEPQRLTVIVADDGPGIPAEFLPHLFEKFSRARGTENAQGAGLGLAIAKGIMEAHGGSIAAESAMQNVRGTRIRLEFPREVAQQ